MKLKKTLVSGIALLSITSLSACKVNDLTNENPTKGASVQSGQYTLTQLPDQSITKETGMTPIINAVNAAKSYVSIEVYSLNDQKLENALVAATKRGVSVHIMLDSAFNGNKFNAHAYSYLASNKVPVEWAPTGYIFHIKTAIIDDVAYISTANFNANDYATYRDGIITDVNSKQVSAINSTFKNDWDLNGKPKDNTVNADGLIWSPGAQDAFIAQINKAKTSIQFSSEEIKGQPLIQAIANKAKTGVACNILVDSSNASGEGITNLKSAGCEISSVNKTSSHIYEHQKVLIIDGSNAVIGSQNDSSSSLNRNRELSVVLDQSSASSIINQLSNTFSDDTKLVSSSN